jgi:hypothetical protein
MPHLSAVRTPLVAGGTETLGGVFEIAHGSDAVVRDCRRPLRMTGWQTRPEFESRCKDRLCRPKVLGAVLMGTAWLRRVRLPGMQ